MEQQQVFATTWRGFDKKAVLEYIYEQDVLFKKREAELNEKLAEYENNQSGQQYVVGDEQLPELYQERIDALEQSCNEQRETAVILQEQCEKLRREADQLVQMARSKDGELQLQVEVNRQLQQKCDMLESKLKTLAEHLLSERETAADVKPVPDNADEPDCAETEEKPIEIIPELDEAVQDDNTEKSEFTDLRGEINDFKQSVSQTLLNFEAALARLEVDPSFFR